MKKNIYAVLITSSTAIFVGVVWKVNGRPPNFDPSGANTIEGIELKIGRINYLASLTKQVKLQISNHSGVV